MRKIIVLLIVLIAVIGMSGCATGKAGEWPPDDFGMEDDMNGEGDAWTMGGEGGDDGENEGGEEPEEGGDEGEGDEGMEGNGDGEGGEQGDDDVGEPEEGGDEGELGMESDDVGCTSKGVEESYGIDDEHCVGSVSRTCGEDGFWSEWVYSNVQTKPGVECVECQTKLKDDTAPDNEEESELVTINVEEGCTTCDDKPCVCEDGKCVHRPECSKISGKTDCDAAPGCHWSGPVDDGMCCPKGEICCENRKDKFCTAAPSCSSLNDAGEHRNRWRCFLKDCVSCGGSSGDEEPPPEPPAP